MNRIEKIQYLNQILLEEMPEYQETAAWFPQGRSLPAVPAPQLNERTATHTCKSEIPHRAGCAFV